MKERTRRIDAEANRESGGVIVPEKQPNREAPVLTAERLYCRFQTQSN
ncbi:hypothetical protein [Candidatus Chlorobium masyuteum]|nr:hypothetical protein [Candidatus Chlorobium masyuteum]